MDTETRVRELEEDMLRVIEMCLTLEATVTYQERIMKKLLEGLAEERADR